MSRAKELADVYRNLSIGAGPVGATRSLETAAMLDRLAAIDSAVPGEVGEIKRRFELYGMCDADARALLAIVQRQAGEIAELRAQPAISMDARLSADLAAARAEVERLTEQNAIRRKQEALKDADRAQLSAEVERLKAQLAEHADHPHMYICPQVAKNAADMGKERDALKAAKTAITAENARLVNEHAAAMSRADVLAEGVRLLARCANSWHSEFPKYQEWRRDHGHMVSK